MLKDIKKDAADRMAKSVASLKHELTKIRTGRAHTSLLDHITVEYYGAQSPLNQVSNVGVEDARTLIVTPWDKSMVPVIEKAIQNSDLGLNPATDGQLIRVPIPALSEERRVEMTKIAGKYAEQARVAVRNVRRDGMEMLKKMEKDNEISKDEHHLWSEEIQGLTDKHIKGIDEALAHKEEEILQV